MTGCITNLPQSGAMTQYGAQRLSPASRFATKAQKEKVTSRHDVLMVSTQVFFLRLQTEDKTGMLGLAIESSFLRALLLTAVSECRVGSLSCARSPALP
jgi:hypothetical protein